MAAAIARDGERIVPEETETRLATTDTGYSDESFWKKARTHALRAGREVIEKALTLYYCLKDGDTPGWAKTVIVGALAYFILPTDAIPDYIAAVGFTDDLGALAAAAATVAAHLKKEHRTAARELVERWFGEAEGKTGD